nr:MAG TPA: hypothetical protein [Bacteriophage sp.]DAG77385.1 MAG TPA: hypothetical protein [Caudoviricetes sp.]
MLHLIGKPYILQHCRIAARNEQLAISYQAYMTDMLSALAGAQERWYDRVADLVESRPQQPKPSSEEVIAHIKNGLNGGDGT